MFRIESLGGDKHAIIAVDKRKFDRDHPTGFEIGALKAASPNSQSSEIGNMNKQSRGKAAKIQTTSQIDLSLRIRRQLLHLLQIFLGSSI
ncbi:hypothetical protein FBR06_10590 [Betaproteobacteria bacterium PRO4]|nr:hypothetical protein [Betaproteobacteria bacterium PRO4]